MQLDDQHASPFLLKNYTFIDKLYVGRVLRNAPPQERTPRRGVPTSRIKTHYCLHMKCQNFRWKGVAKTSYMLYDGIRLV